MSDQKIQMIQSRLTDAGFSVSNNKELSHGVQLKLDSGQIVNVYNNGTVQVQGKDPEPVRDLLKNLGTLQSDKAAIPQKQTLGKVFVVYGHDESAKDQIQALLLRWGIEPMFLDQLPSEGLTIIEKLEKYREQAKFAVILATPDDVGHRKNHPDEKTFRARQNVVLELGMMLAKLGREKVAILVKDQEKMERPSDIQGLIYIPYKERVDEGRIQLAKELCQQGLKVEVDSL